MAKIPPNQTPYAAMIDAFPASVSQVEHFIDQNGKGISFRVAGASRTAVLREIDRIGVLVTERRARLRLMGPVQYTKDTDWVAYGELREAARDAPHGRQDGPRSIMR
jgi:hypothetical protein